MRTRAALVLAFAALAGGFALHPALGRRETPDERGAPPAALPRLEIVAPIALTQLPAGVPVRLAAALSDAEDAKHADLVRWRSSRDGALGEGIELRAPLSTGIHTLTAELPDGAGAAHASSLEVEVTAGSYTLLTAGDIASCTSEGDEATAALLDRRFGTVLTLGDNAYRSGSLVEFQRCYAPTWGRHKARTRPALGNHEYRTEGAGGHFAYFGAAAGEPGQGWYGFDLGSWRVVVLNSNCREAGGCKRSSPQARWLAAELAAHPRACTLAAWHHPRFSSGSKHGSIDKLSDLYAIFHEHGGDVVLSGHDHNYERFAQQDAAGRADPGAPRQFVVGTGGGSQRKMGGTVANSVASAGGIYGVLALTLRERSYDWEFLPAAGYTFRDAGRAECVGPLAGAGS